MKQKIHPAVVVIVILVILGGIFGTMYVLSEAPKSNHPPRFAGGGG
jgi:hypothetical protein